jgi:hypothetical protein
MRRSLSAAFALLAAAWPLAASAFGTVNAPPWDAEHEKITRLAFRTIPIGPNTLDQLAGAAGAFGAVGAPDNPVRGLLFTSAAHCDDGDHLTAPGYPQTAPAARAQLQACRTWMLTYLHQAVQDAGDLADAAGVIRNPTIALTTSGCTFTGTKGRPKCNVLEDLGLVLHASQDFYSHSNWVDVAAPGGPTAANPPGLGQTGRAAWLDLSVAAPPFPQGLITGCFVNVPEDGLGYCITNGVVRVKHKVLNKDTGPIAVGPGPLSGLTIGPGTSARGAINNNFRHAVEAAVGDTTDKWLYFSGLVLHTYPGLRGQRILCAVMRDNPATCP